MKNIVRVLIYLFFWFLVWFSLVITFPLILFLLMPKVTILSQIALLLPDPRFILVFSFICSVLYASVRNLRVSIFLNLRKRKQSNTKYFYLTIGLSLLTSYFLWNGFSFLNRFGLLAFMLLSFIQFFFYLFYLGVIEDGYAQAKKTVHRLLKIKKRQLFWDYRKTILVGLLCALLIIFAGILIYNEVHDPLRKMFNEKVKKKIIEDRTPRILDIQPYVTYHMIKVVLKGDNFGWQDKPLDIKSKLFLNQGENVTVDLWTDKKIIFTVPLSWELGKNIIYVEKYIEYDGKLLKKEINKVAFIIISRTGEWDKNDDLYFNQLENLDEETLRINGYQSP